MAISISRVAAESKMMLRFATIGILATFIHMTIALCLLAAPNFPVVAANTIAFVAAFSASFAGNYFWTFRVHVDFRRSLMRYLVVASGAFLANSLALSGLLATDQFAPRIAIVISAAIVPVCTFALSRLWAFRNCAHAQDAK